MAVSSAVVMPPTAGSMTRLFAAPAATMSEAGPRPARAAVTGIAGRKKRNGERPAVSGATSHCKAAAAKARPTASSQPLAPDRCLQKVAMPPVAAKDRREAYSKRRPPWLGHCRAAGRFPQSGPIMPRSHPARPRRTPARWIAVWLLACPLIAAAAGVIDDDENALIASLRDEASRYETGNGIDKDGERAAALYCKAARLGDAESQFRLGWIYTSGIAVPRNDTLAAFFFQIAAEQGIEQATRMLGMVGGPTQDVPACMRDPVPGDTALAA